ncbi:MAG: hypothetical protein ABL919_05760 [Methylococcales bacterium]|nr:hypothetical protein [Methylococcaceae bacterium]
MSTLDHTIHALGALLLISLGVLSLRIEGKRLKRIVTRSFVLVLAVLLADAAMHLLPNALAGFIYRTS